MYSDCVKSARTAKDRNFTTTNPLANTALSQSERAYYLSKWKSRICLNCDVTMFCIALAIQAITINLCLVYIETTVCLITNHCFNEWKAHISKHLCRNFDNLFIRNKNWLRAQLVSMYILIRACNNDSFLSFETLPANETGKTSNVDWLRLRNKMTQGRIAVKGNRGFCRLTKSCRHLWTYVLVITKFSNFLQRPNSSFCRSANRFSFFVDVYYIAEYTALWLKYKLGFSKDDEASKQERKNHLHDDVILRPESFRVLLSCTN